MLFEDKEYLYDREKILQNTITIDQLINILKKYPKDMKVMITWESTVKEIQPENIYEAYTGTLYLDADCNFYKDDFKKKY